MKPVLIEGGFAIDDRGVVSFVNGFEFAGGGFDFFGEPMMPPVCRFYIVANHHLGFVRAWHGHKKEAKYVTAVSGTALVCAVRVEEQDWNRIDDSQDPKLRVNQPQRFILSASKPAVLFIPPGYANGWMSLTPDARLMFFSTLTLEESKTDDYRFPARYWNPWKVEER